MGSNLVQNGDFESGSLDPGWSAVTGYPSVIKEEFMGGVYSLQLG